MQYFQRYLLVFNVEQCEGVPPLVEQEEKKINQEQYVTDVANGMKVKLLNDGGDNAYYSPFEDTVHLPIKMHSHLIMHTTQQHCTS